ncbi:hypothetical protein ACHWQZ_G018986 [Mnemiopsis leidyi]
MKFAALGSSDQEGDLPRRLISSATMALSRVFLTKSRQNNRKIVQDALVTHSREARKGNKSYQKHLSCLEKKVLGKPQKPTPPCPCGIEAAPTTSRYSGRTSITLILILNW